MLKQVAVVILALNFVMLNGCGSGGGGSAGGPSPQPPTGTTPGNTLILSYTVISGNQIDLEWTASSVGVAGYKIYRDGAAVGSTSATTYSDRGLSQKTKYCYGIVAYNAAGNVAVSSGVCPITADASISLKWKYETGPSYYSSPAIGEDGTIYIGNSVSAEQAGSYSAPGLSAIHPDGSLKWKYVPRAIGAGAMRSSPAIGPDGTIYARFEYAVSPGTEFVALNPDGTVKWKHSLNSFMGGTGVVTPAIGLDGMIYGALLADQFDPSNQCDVGASCGASLQAINPDGTRGWRSSNLVIGQDLSSSPAIGSDGTIYVTATDIAGQGLLFAIDSTGTNKKWTYLTDLNDSCPISTGFAGFFSSPSIDSNGTIYVGNDNGYLYAINPDGSLKWKYCADLLVRTSPAIGTDGTIYFGTKNTNFSHDTYFYAMNPNGTLKWKYFIGSDVYSSPAIDSNGLIYTASEHPGYLYAFNPDGTLAWQYDTGEFGDIDWPSPAISQDGTIYIANWYYDRGNSRWAGSLFAIQSPSVGLANSPWPKFHRNNKNTGR